MDDDDEGGGGGEGAPAWMTTYGDMITLLLCFFVLLFTMMEIKKEKVTRTMRQFQRQFSVLPAQQAVIAMSSRQQTMNQTQTYVLRNGPKGTSTAVKTIVTDEKTKITVGGSDLFRPDSAELTPNGELLLQTKIAPMLRGYRNRIDVRGNTASSSYEDGWYLGFQRAYAVMMFLSQRCDIASARFRVTTCADNEPVSSNQTPEGRERNRRVDIIMTEEFVRNGEQ
ncbi:membrane protein [Planctomycetales bacterium]|nr:membrane protein [Planctomycetales bacterium]GHS98700.1 membrane protein [Planctomycetales bacterium]GHT08543.1 membrane protein [Planctomycetales bacterium]